MNSFDPNDVGIKGSLFGLPWTVDEADVIVLPMPWDVTVSYGAGTGMAPQIILEESSQIDYFRLDKPLAWKTKVAMAKIPEEWLAKGKLLREKAEKYINWLENGSEPSMALLMENHRIEINQECFLFNEYVRQETDSWHKRGKKTIVLGGDHSTPLGHIMAIAKMQQIGVLQIDAHADLRKDYEGFEYSHASIMRNALQADGVNSIVSVGVRDLCEEEALLISEDARLICFFDQRLKERLYQGESWSNICHEIIGSLPEKVYLSVDVDGLDPSHCPSTGTPVPGGLSFDQLKFLIAQLKLSGKTIVGADLVEVGAEVWDANVGTRVLWELVHLIA